MPVDSARFLISDRLSNASGYALAIGGLQGAAARGPAGRAGGVVDGRLRGAVAATEGPGGTRRAWTSAFKLTLRQTAGLLTCCQC